MHDPMTVAFTVPRPWPARRTDHRPANLPRYWPALITIWHVDPEKGGDDDSCGFSCPKMTAVDRDWARQRAGHMWRERFEYDGANFRQASAIEILTSVWCEARTQLTAKRPGYIYAPLPRRDSREITQLCVSSVGNVHGLVAAAKESPEGMERLLLCVVRCQRRLYRPWYRHPRFHFHHWKVQVHPLQDLKRFLFSRCAGCGRGFRWGYAPVSMQWGGRGPRWFRGEPNIYHAECAPRLTKSAPEPVLLDFFPPPPPPASLDGSDQVVHGG